MNFNQWMNSIDLQVGNPHFAWLMAFVPVALGVSIWAAIRRNRALKTFGTTESEQGHRSTFSRLISTGALALSIVLLSLALIDFRWGKTTYEVPQKGLEVVFALDVSRSMLAQDASPNRLKRAKQQIKDMVDEMAGDRVGLVIFAGEADQAVPLTSHYDAFKQTLDSVGPHSIPVGGSQLGVALKAASEAFISKTNEHKTIVLFTDGEDQESEPVKLAQQLHADEGIRVFTIGLGDFEQGARIPDDQSRSQSFVQHQGQQVWSKLNGRILKKIATETAGAYIPAGTKRVNMADVYHGYVAKVEQTEFETAKINAYVPRFQWFTGAALFFLLIEIWLTSGSKRKLANKNHQSSSSKSSSRASTLLSGTAKTAAAIVFLLLIPGNVFAQQANSTAKKINAANELVRQQKSTDAIEAYSQIESVAEAEAKSQINYNLAVAHYRNSDYAAAIPLFGEASKSLNREIATSSRHNLGNCHYAQALPLVESEPDAAIEQLQQAIVHFRSSLRLDRSNTDSRSNIELARKLIKQIQNQQEQDESDQNKQDSQQDSQENESPDSQHQQDQQQQDPSQDSTNQNNSSESQKPDQGSESESESTGEPEDQSNQTPESENNQTGEQTDAKPNQKSPRQSEPANTAKPQDEQQSNKTDQQSANQPKQPTPEQIAGELTADNQSKENKASKSAARVNQASDVLMTRQEALKMLQAVRDRDMLRRLEQQRRQRIQRVPVEKDW